MSKEAEEAAKAALMPPRKRNAPKRQGKRNVVLAPEPRAVPLAAQAAMCFGGVLAGSGWLLLAASSPFVWMYPLHSDIVTPFFFAGETATTTGAVLGLRYVGRRQLATSPGHVSQGVPTLAVGFEYVVEGVLYEDMSFRQSFISTTISEAYAPGASVQVEYVKARPYVGRIRGMRYQEHSWMVGWVLALPLIGAILVASRLCAASGQIELLRAGAVTHGQLVEKRAGGADDGSVTAVVFEYCVPAPSLRPQEDIESAADHGACKASSAKSTKPKGKRDAYQPLVEPTVVHRLAHYDVNTSLVEDEEWEPVLYLPAQPSTSALVDSLPLTLSAEGEWHAQCSLWWSLLGPISTVAINMLCAWSYVP